MTRLFVTLVILLLCVSVVIGCGTPSPAKPTTPTTPATTAKPAVPTTPTAPAATTKPVATTAPTTTTPAKPAASGTPIYGGKVTVIDPSSPGCPLGLPWQCRQPYVGVQLCNEALIGSLKDGTITPKLAESWEINSDPKNPSYTFRLRKGVKFHDGTDFNAQAFVWNFKKYTEGGMLSVVRYIKSYDILDDYTLRMPLTMWRNTILPAFLMAPIVSPTAFDKNGEEGTRWNTVGTGPYKQADFARDVSFRAVRNENYWDKGKPYLFEVEYLSVPEELTRLALFKSGKGDIMNLNKNGRVAAELQAQGNQIITQMSGTMSLMPDSANATSPWSNLKARQAAEYAIDKEQIAKALGFGFGKAAYQWYPEGTMPYNPVLPGRKYDPAKAKQLLSEAGFPNGFKTKIIAQSTENRDVVVSIQSYLKAVGIDTDLDFPEPAKYTSYTLGTWENALLCTTMQTGAQPTQGIAFTATPRTQFKGNLSPPNWMPMYDKIMTTPTLDQNVLWEGFKAIYDDVMIIPVMYVYDMFQVSKKLQDHGIGTRQASTTWNTQEAWLSK